MMYEQVYFRIKDTIKANNKRGIKATAHNQLLRDIISSNGALNYSTKRPYIAGCAAIFDGELYVANAITMGVFNPSHWDAINWSMLHPYTEDYKTRLIAAGDDLSGGLISAVDDFFTNTDSILSRIYRMNLFICDSFTGAMVPMIYNLDGSATPMGNATDTNTNFVSGDWGITTGLAGDGTKYLLTGFIPNSHGVAANNFGLGLWNTTAGSQSAIDMGCYSATEWTMLGVNVGGTTYGAIGQSAAVNHVTGTDTGFQFATRNGDDANKYYVNGTLDDNQTLAGTTVPTKQLAIYRSDENPDIGLTTSRTYYGYWASKGLSGAQVTLLYDELTTLFTAIGR